MLISNAPFAAGSSGPELSVEKGKLEFTLTSASVAGEAVVGRRLAAGLL